MPVELTEVGDGVIAVRGRDVNWTILRDGASFTSVSYTHLTLPTKRIV